MTPEAIATRVRGSRVLLIEDHPVNQRVVTSLLERAGFEVTTVRSGGEGVALAIEADYSLVLVDLRLPDMSGLEVARRIRVAESERRLPLIAVSADSDADCREAGRLAGLDDHLAKPIDPCRLYSAVVRWLDLESAPDDASLLPLEAAEPPGAEPPVVDSDALVRGRAIGLDLAKGLRLFGDWAAYRSALSGFVRMYRKRRSTGRAREFDAPPEFLHALAGACGAIGAAALATDAARLENDWRVLDSASRLDEFDRFGQALDTFVENLRVELPNLPASASPAPSL